MPRQVPVGPGTRVRLNFAIHLVDGVEIDSTKGRPAAFTVGDGNLLPGFERALFGLRAGDRKTLEIAASDGFGDHNPENVQVMSRAEFDKDIDLEVGLIVSFADKQKAELPGVVSRINGEVIEVDFNHPLAGRDLLFDVEIIDVTQVSNEIARSG